MIMHPLVEEERADQRGEIMLRREIAKWSNAARKADALRVNYPGQVIDRRSRRVPSRPDGRPRAHLCFYRHGHFRRSARGLRGADRRKAELQSEPTATIITDYGMSEEEAREPFRDYIAALRSPGEQEMKAAVYPGQGQPIAIETLPDPETRPQGVIIKVHRCGALRNRPVDDQGGDVGLWSGQPARA
jgi:hypothetical protein